MILRVYSTEEDPQDRYTQMHAVSLQPTYYFPYSSFSLPHLWLGNSLTTGDSFIPQPKCLHPHAYIL